MAFTASDVKALREKTGVGMMDCKKALVESDGDMDKAIDFLREKGLAAATKKASRIAAEGVVMAYTDEAKQTRNDSISDFDLELEDLKKLQELFFKNINFLKAHKEETRLELVKMQKMKRFLKN